VPKIQLDNIEYNTEDLSERAQATLKTLQFLEIQLQKLNNEIEIYQTAKRQYLYAIKAEIKSQDIEPVTQEYKSENQSSVSD
jgi:hypothetical protein